MRVISVAGIGIAVLIEFLLLSKKNKSASDQILTVWMFLIVVHMLLFYSWTTEEIYNYPFLLGLEQPIPLLHGVLLYLYVSFLTNQLPQRRLSLLLHFIPATAMYLYLIVFFVLPADQKILIYRNHGAGFEVFNLIRRYAVAFSGIFYVSWSAILLRKHQNNVRDQFSSLEKVSLQWLRFLTIGMGCIWFLVIVFRNEILTFAGIVVFVFLVGFFGAGQTDIFVRNETSAGEEEQKKKYPKSGLTEELSRKLHQSLLDLMVKEAPYRKSDISIGDLSSRLGVHPNYLSQIINEREGKNFYDFVNTYRVEEFRRLIAMPRNQHLTLLSVAYDCGFNSKSSFNRYFKKATGQTPSEYFTTLTKGQSISS